MKAFADPTLGRVRSALSRLQRVLPVGRSLPDAVWRKRHRGIVVLVGAQALGLVVFALVRGYPLAHSLLEGAVVALVIPAASWKRMSRTFRAGSATFGLLTASALLVHFSGGVIETHFHFFVMLGVISLYQDWTPFLLALGFVVVHHGTVGVLDPAAVYNHPAARAHPWVWALIHGVFVLGASAACLVSWRLNEQSRAHSELILNSAGEGIFGLDRDGRITFLNSAAARMIGRPESAVVGNDVHDVLHDQWLSHRPDECPLRVETDSGARPAIDMFVRTDKTTFAVEYSSRPIRERGVTTGSVVTFGDITDRQRADAELRSTLSLLSATLESTADGILVVDKGGKITSLNQKFIEMWRIPEDVVTSRDDDRALAYVLEQLTDPQAFLAKVRELYAHPDAESHDILEFKDGRVFERYSQPQRVAGVGVGRVWSFRDVTERRRLDRLKDDFLSAVSHELRTPLSAVLGYAVTLERPDPIPAEQQRDLLGRLSANARKLQRLLNDTLDLDRLSRGILEPNRNPTNLTALIHRVVDELSAMMYRTVEFSLDQVVASVDAAKVERIVENLLINAAKHTPPGTPVWIRLWSADGGAYLAVEDAGPGVPEELRHVVFESFRQGPTVASHAPGFGIGLSLVARFAELHGGRAWVADREGGGASFRVFVPDVVPESLCDEGDPVEELPAAG